MPTIVSLLEMCRNPGFVKMKFILHVAYLFFVYLYAGSDWEVCETGCLFAPVHCAREVWSYISVINLYNLKYRWNNVIKVVFICPCSLSFQLWKHSTTLWTPIFVRKTKTSRCILMVCSVRCLRLWFFLISAGGMIRKPKCTMLCSACRRFHPPSFTCYEKELTQTGTFVSLWVHVWVSLCI